MPDDQVPQDTTVLYSQDDTTVLEQEEYGTTVLNSNIYDNDFVIEYEIIYIHTDEIIDAEV